MEFLQTRKLLDTIVQNEITPGMNILVSLKQKIIWKESFGLRLLNNESATVKLNTIYDLASLTKVVATLPIILKLLEIKSLDLDGVIADYLPDFKQTDKAEITIKQLLTHTSGLPPGIVLKNENPKQEEVFQVTANTSLVANGNTGVIYSDINYILLRYLAEEVTQQSFDELFNQWIGIPLQMERTGFNLSKYNLDEFAATEKSPINQQMKYNIVHDPTAEYLNGVSGHAGLFSTIEDIHQFAIMIEQMGRYKDTQVLTPEWLQQARYDYTSFHQELKRGLGWELKNGNNSCGQYFSDLSYGHTGFTGTSLWFDPTIELHVIILANRVNSPKGIEFAKMRRDIHDAIRNELGI